MDNFDLKKYLAEGRLFENTNLNDVLKTPQDLIIFITGGEESDFGEAEEILDDITDVEGSVIGGETVWHNQGEFEDEDDYEFDDFKEKYFDVDKPLTKKDVIQHLLINALDYDYHAERGIGDNDEVPDDWEERQHKVYSDIAQKAKDKYGIEGIY